MGPRLEQGRIVLIVEGRAHHTVTPFVERYFPILIGIGDSKNLSVKQRFLIHDERNEFWTGLERHEPAPVQRYRIVIQRTVKTSQRDFSF